MEHNVSPTFTDPVILKFLDEAWLSSQSSDQLWKGIPTGHSMISVSFNGTEYPNLHITFRDYNNDLVGSFSYHLKRSSISMELTPFFVESFFLETFGKQNSYLSKAAAIERLMDYPDFKEWLLWNRP